MAGIVADIFFSGNIDPLKLDGKEKRGGGKMKKIGTLLSVVSIVILAFAAEVEVRVAGLTNTRGLITL